MRRLATTPAASAAAKRGTRLPVSLRCATWVLRSAAVTRTPNAWYSAAPKPVEATSIDGTASASEPDHVSPSVNEVLASQEFRADRLCRALRQAKSWDVIARAWSSQPSSFVPEVLGNAVYYAAATPGAHTLTGNSEWETLVEAAGRSVEEDGGSWAWADLARLIRGTAWVINPHPAARWNQDAAPPTSVRAPPAAAERTLLAAAQEVQRRIDSGTVWFPSVSVAARCAEGFAYAYCGDGTPVDVRNAVSALHSVAANSSGKWSAEAANGVLVSAALCSVIEKPALDAALQALPACADWLRSEVLASSMWACAKLQRDHDVKIPDKTLRVFADKVELSRWSLRPRDAGTVLWAFVELGIATPRSMACLSEVLSDAAWRDKLVGSNRAAVIAAFDKFLAAMPAQQPELGDGKAVRSKFSVQQPDLASEDSAQWPWNVRTAAPLSVLAL